MNWTKVYKEIGEKYSVSVKGKRDRDLVTEAVNHIPSYNLPYLAKKRLRELLENLQ